MPHVDWPTLLDLYRATLGLRRGIRLRATRAEEFCFLEAYAAEPGGKMASYPQNGITLKALLEIPFVMNPPQIQQSEYCLYFTEPNLSR